MEGMPSGRCERTWVRQRPVEANPTKVTAIGGERHNRRSVIVGGNKGGKKIWVSKTNAQTEAEGGRHTQGGGVGGKRAKPEGRCQQRSKARAQGATDPTHAAQGEGPAD